MMGPGDVPRVRTFCKRAWERVILQPIQEKDGKLKPADKTDAPRAALYALMELWFNGDKISSEMHPHQLNVTTYYIGLFAQVDRAETDLRTTATLSYSDVEKDGLIQNGFKGEVADVHMYDTALPAEAIRKLADK